MVMINSESDNREVKFFAAVSKNCKTVIVEKSKNNVRQKINHKRITRNNIAIFECCTKGKNTIVKKLIHRPKFKLTSGHHIVIVEASRKFLAQMEIS